MPLEYQYLSQYHGMANPAANTPIGKVFGLPTGPDYGGEKYDSYGSMDKYAMGLGPVGKDVLGMVPWMGGSMSDQYHDAFGPVLSRTGEVKHCNKYTPSFILSVYFSVY